MDDDLPTPQPYHVSVLGYERAQLLALVDADVAVGVLPGWIRDMVWERLYEARQQAERERRYQRARQLVYSVYL